MPFYRDHVFTHLVTVAGKSEPIHRWRMTSVSITRSILPRATKTTSIQIEPVVTSSTSL
jgi:hypothetical protein